MAHSSWLSAPEALPLHQPAEALADFGRTVILAPHPDDETLGCGGLLALLPPDAGRVIVLTDGTGSHPASKRFPANARRELREAETLAALAQLGIRDAAKKTTFLRLPDGKLPHASGDPHFTAAATTLAKQLRDDAPDTLLVPWRRDPHADHRATFQLASAAVQNLDSHKTIRWIEYPVWLWERAMSADLPNAEEDMRVWRLDISTVLTTKLAAIQAHRSQTTNLIDDDPGGFRLAPSMLAHFHRPWELFLETTRPPFLRYHVR